MSDSTDDLMARLADADPVDARAIPSADSTHASSLLASIVTNEVDDTTDDLTPVGARGADGDGNDEVAMLTLPDVHGIDRYRSTQRSWRGRGAFLASAAAVIALIAGFALFSSTNTEPALANVQSAAGAAADAESGRIDTTFTATGTDGELDETLSGSVKTSYDGADIAVVVDLDGGVEAFPESVEIRLVDGTLYGKEPDAGRDTWYALEDSGFVGGAIGDMVDPRTIFDTVQDLIEVDEVGSSEVDGISTTHYRSVIDLEDESLSQSGWLAGGMGEIEAEGEVTVDLYVDDAGVLRKLDLSGDLVEADDGGGTATFLVESRFHDFGAEVNIEKPDDATIVDPFSDLGEGHTD